jgi:SWIM zinc finger
LPGATESGKLAKITACLGKFLPLTLEQIEALAPDQASLAAARGLLKPSTWVSLVHDGADLCWGECSGSGSTPYRVAITELDSGYKCSCPSRKFPCKHSLALFWLRAEAKAPFAAGSAPEWVLEWQSRRRPNASMPKADESTSADSQTARASISALSSDEAQNLVDSKDAAKAEAAKARNRAQREALIHDGLAALDRWILDELERGMAGFETRADDACKAMAKRLVDAKAGGLANCVERLPAQLMKLPAHARSEHALLGLGQLHLLASAYRQQAQLSPIMREEIRQLMGWSLSREQLLNDAQALRVRAHWMVVGLIDEVQPDRLRRLETWFVCLHAPEQSSGINESAPQFAVLIDFQPISIGAGSHTYAVADVIDAELCYFPSELPMRAVISQSFGAVALSPTVKSERFQPKHSDLSNALLDWQQALAHQPWLADYPIALKTVSVRAKGDALYACGNGQTVALNAESCEQASPLIGLKPLKLFGLFNGRELQPLFAETPIGNWNAGNWSAGIWRA